MKNKQDLLISTKYNLEVFNCHLFLIIFVMLIISLEQDKVDIQTICSLRFETIEPLGSIKSSTFKHRYSNSNYYG